MNWVDKCHKCGVNIFNGIPEGENISQYVEKKKSEGYIVGYREKPVGIFGMMHNVAIKPICTICSSEERRSKSAKDKIAAMRKIGKIVKKEFTCPCCFHSVEMGYNTEVFKSASKAAIIDHINEKHNTEEIKAVLPYDKRDDY